MVKALPDILATIVEQKKLDLAVREQTWRSEPNAPSHSAGISGRSDQSPASHHRRDQESVAQ